MVLGVAGPNLGREGSSEEITAFLADHGYTFPVVLDETGVLFSQYGIAAYPTTFMIDTEGNLFGYVESALTGEMMESIVQQTIEGKKRKKQSPRTMLSVGSVLILCRINPPAKADKPLPDAAALLHQRVPNVPSGRYSSEKTLPCWRSSGNRLLCAKGMISRNAKLGGGSASAMAASRRCEAPRRSWPR